MARVTLIGAHGKVGLLAMPLLVEAGHEVTGIIRRPEQADAVNATGATAVVADVEQLSVDDLAALLGGSEVVVWSAGAGGGSPERTYAVDRDAAVRTIDAAEQATVDRFVMVSYFGAGADHGVPPDNPFFAYAEAKAAADAHLEASSLSWTILAPSALTLDEPSGHVEAGEGVTGSHVSRGNVARVIAAVVDASTGTAGRVIAFNDGATPIADVVQGRGAAPTASS